MDGNRRAARDFTELLVWQKACELVVRVYEFSGLFPSSEAFALTSQLRRAAVSVTSNIAEGFGRRSRREKLRFLDIARGSLEECRNDLLVAEKLNYGDASKTMAKLEETSRLLYRYERSIRHQSGSRESKSGEQSGRN